MVVDRKLSFLAFWFENLKDEKSVAQVLSMLARVGYTGVDWKSTCFDPEQDMAAQLKRAVHLADDMGMATCANVILGNMIDDKRETYIERATAFIRANAEAGIRVINTAPGSAPDTAESWGRLTDTLERILRVCDECDVDIALESVVGNLVHDYETTDKLLTLVPNRHLRLTMDASHYHLYKSDIPAAIRALGTKRIVHVHLKDAIGDATRASDGQWTLPNEWTFPMLGAGNIDWVSFFGALDEIGYDGYMSIEFEVWRYMEQVLGGNVESAARLSLASANALIHAYQAAKKEG